jgi:signal transduction histidine kinase
MNTGLSRTGACTAAGLSGTAIVLGAPHVRFLYELPRARVAADTAVVLAGTLVALLCIGRFRRYRRPRDLAVVVAMALLAGAEPVFGGVASIFAPYEGPRLTPQVARLLAAGALAAASTFPTARPGRGSGRWGGMAPATMAVTAAAVLAVLLWKARPTSLAPGLSDSARILGDPLVSAASLAAAGLFAVATMGFTARRQPADPFLGWLGTGCALSAIASLNYALYPSTSLSVLHVGDVVRLAAVGAWLLGGLLELRSHWDAQAALARADERRALARDLHDGLAQELAFIASQSGSSLTGSDPAWRAEIAAAARRALVESRRVVSTLAPAPTDEAVADIAQSAAAVALQAGVGLRFDVEQGRRLSPSERDALVQIVREAVGNAARHGVATGIHVELAPGRVARITDDGVGFDPADAHAPGHFGLISMRERAEAMGARLDVRSGPGQGTVVEVSWL